MIHLFKKNSLTVIFAQILLINCNLLNAQNLTWKQPINAGYNCFSVDLDSTNYIYSICEIGDLYPGFAFFDTIPFTVTLPVSDKIFVTKTDTNNIVSWINVLETSWSFYQPIMKISPSQKVIVSGSVRDRFICDTVDQLLPGGTPPVFIVQLDIQGKLNWFNRIKNRYVVFGSDITFDSENNICIVGSTFDTIAFGDFDKTGKWIPSISYAYPQKTEGFIAKYSPTGKFLAAKVFPVIADQGGAYLYVKSAICDNEDNIYLTGWFEGKIQCDSTTIESDGIEVIIIKFNKNMEIVWSKHFGPGNPYSIQQGNSLAFDKSKKNFYVTGNFIGSKDFGNGLVQSNDKNIFLAKYSLDGKLKWVKNFGSWSGAASYTEEGQKLYVDDDDFVYLGGIFYSTLQIGDTAIEAYNDPNVANNYSDIFIAKFFANGDFSWATHAGNIRDDKLGSIVKDKYNHVFVSGYTQGGAMFGDHTIIAPAESGQLGFLACFNDMSETNKYETSFGIEESKNVLDKIKIFPNPFIKNFEVQIQNTERSDISIQLIDLNGKTLFSDSEKSGNIIQNYSYQLNKEPSGIYCIKITIGNNFYTYKIVKI